MLYKINIFAKHNNVQIIDWKWVVNVRVMDVTIALFSDSTPSLLTNCWITCCVKRMTCIITFHVDSTNVTNRTVGIESSKSWLKPEKDATHSIPDVPHPLRTETFATIKLMATRRKLILLRRRIPTKMSLIYFKKNRRSTLLTNLSKGNNILSPKFYLWNETGWFHGRRTGCFYLWILSPIIIWQQMWWRQELVPSRLRYPI